MIYNTKYEHTCRLLSKPEPMTGTLHCYDNAVLDSGARDWGYFAIVSKSDVRLSFSLTQTSACLLLISFSFQPRDNCRAVKTAPICCNASFESHRR